MGECVAAGHDAAETVTIQGKINRLQFLKSDLPYQNNIWTQQVRNNPKEWHRFQQTNQPFIAWQEQLRRQASHMQHPTACKKKQTKPPNTAVENTDCWPLSHQACGFMRRGEAIPTDLRGQLSACVQQAQQQKKEKGPVRLDDC